MIWVSATSREMSIRFVRGRSLCKPALEPHAADVVRDGQVPMGRSRGRLYLRILFAKDGRGRRRGKGMAAVEIVPCVRLGSIVFGEKSYEMDANAELSEGPIVTKGR